MNSWQADARAAAQRYGLGDWFVNQMGLEAHGQDLTSRAGAEGPAQFMPGTARSVGLTSSTVHQRVPAYNAAAKLMAGYVKQYGGDVRKALVAYNAGPGAVGRPLVPETQNYLKTILGGSNPMGHVSAPTASSSLAAPSSAPAGQSSPGDPGQAGDFTSLVSSLLSQKPQAVPQMSAIPAPAFAAGPTLPQGAPTLQPLGGPAPPAQDRVQAALGLVGALGGTDPTLGSSSGVTGAQTGSSAPAAASAPGSGPVKMPKGLATFGGKQVAGWIAPALEYARQHGWEGHVVSGYRTDAEQTAIYRSGVRPAALPRSMGGSGSNHEGVNFPTGAVDVDRAHAQQLSDILMNSPYRKQLVYAGSKDPVHFSHPHDGSY